MGIWAVFGIVLPVFGILARRLLWISLILWITLPTPRRKPCDEGLQVTRQELASEHRIFRDFPEDVRAHALDGFAGVAQRLADQAQVCDMGVAGIWACPGTRRRTLDFPATNT
jgi:hypothetical protein